MTRFYTSDTHFGHNNILKFCNRPFASVEENDEELIRRWNEVVGDGDIVHHLGDFAFKGRTRTSEFLARLNGTIHLVVGNHDPDSTLQQDRWASVKHYDEVEDNGSYCVLFHYPIREWNHCYRGAYHLYGHVHGGSEAQGRSIDVGVDCWDYRPVTLPQIKARLIELGQHDYLVPHHKRVMQEKAVDAAVAASTAPTAP